VIGEFIIYKHLPIKNDKTVHLTYPHYDYRFTCPFRKNKCINFFSEFKPEKVLIDGFRRFGRYEELPDTLLAKKDLKSPENTFLAGKCKMVLSMKCTIEKISDKVCRVKLDKYKVYLYFSKLSPDISLIDIKRNTKI